MDHNIDHRSSSIQLLAIIMLFLSVTSPGFGQNTDRNTMGSWMVFSMDNQLTERFSLPVVGILCTEDLAQQTEFGFIRSGISYAPNPRTKVTLGIAYVDSQPLHHYEFESLTTQFWLYEQATLRSGTHFRHRLRLEHRWIEKPNDALFNTRFRYRLEFKQRLNETFYLKCSNEPFFNFEQHYIDQNRFFLGLGCRLAKDLYFEAGYFKTHIKSTQIDRIRVVVHLKTEFFERKAAPLTRNSKNNNLSK